VCVPPLPFTAAWVHPPKETSMRGSAAAADPRNEVRGFGGAAPEVAPVGLFTCEAWG